jgi:hypothetical protein
LRVRLAPYPHLRASLERAHYRAREHARALLERTRRFVYDQHPSSVGSSWASLLIALIPTVTTKDDHVPGPILSYPSTSPNTHQTARRPVFTYTYPGSAKSTNLGCLVDRTALYTGYVSKEEMNLTYVYRSRNNILAEYST